MVLNSRTLAGLLIKYQRLPRGFFWNSFLPSASATIFATLDFIRRKNFSYTRCFFTYVSVDRYIKKKEIDEDLDKTFIVANIFED